MVKSALDLENERLAKKYRPLLVLYPEIADGSQRKDYYRPLGHSRRLPPLMQDYHPRDIRFVLDNVWLRGEKQKPTRDRVLDIMSENKVEFIDLIDKKGPKHVDKFWRVYSGVEKKDNNPEYHRKVYARVIRGNQWFKDYISIQYWMAYFFDDWANVHEMDWEMVAIFIKKTESTEVPVACAYNAHVGSFRKLWQEVQKADDDMNRNPQGLHPVAYIANGSHASYFSGFPPYFNVAEPYVKSMLSTVLRITRIAKEFTDFVPGFNEGYKCFPEVDVIPEPDKNGRWSEEWRWLNFKGRWGSPAKLSPIEWLIAKIPLIRRLPLFFQRPLREAGPHGPNTRIVCWEEPFNWINLECFEAPETKPWIGNIDEDNST